jgi:hypothetical protein
MSEIGYRLPRRAGRAVRYDLIAAGYLRAPRQRRAYPGTIASPGAVFARTDVSRRRPTDMSPKSAGDRDLRTPQRAAVRDMVLIALLLCAVSGALLVAHFDPRQPYRSISTWLLAEPLPALLRNVHFWATQLALAGGSVYAWQRLRVAGRGTAVRWSLVLVLAALAALSGFVLRGDGDAREVQRLMLLAGASGAGARPLTAFVLHLAAGAALAVVFATVPLRGWRPARWHAVTAVALVVGASLFISPGLHDGLDPAYRGPWYLGAVQWAVESGASPQAVLLAALLFVGCMAALPWLPAPIATRLRPLPGLFVIAYVGLCSALLFVRYDEGRLGSAWPAAIGDLRVGWIPGASRPPPPVVRGRAEGCLACHDGVDGLGAAHAPGAIGCAACHGGDPFAVVATRAHEGLILVPGNLADAGRTCGQAACHLATVPRVERSIMTTMAGVIAVNRRVLGEPVHPASPPPNATALGHSVADSHLRELCVSCHLGQTKSEWGPITEESRGGGCNACHLVYEKAAADALARYLGDAAVQPRRIPAVHPSLTVNPGNDHCFGCHSRSSRISTSYEGWHEVHGALPATTPASRLRRLEDGRYFERVTPDIHHEKGLECIDCHVAAELMGSGVLVARKSEQVVIGCADCHAPRLASLSPEALDPESRRLLARRGGLAHPSQRVGATRSGVPLVNVIVDADGRANLRRKRTGETLPLKSPAALCGEGEGHRRLSCSSCHSTWAPRCTTCHTAFDPSGEGFDHLTQRWGKGTWNEAAGPFEAVPPTLGVRLQRGVDGREHGVVETFVPGMIMTFDRNREPDRPADILFRRLYGLTFAHTVRREARSCVSCHADPVALGYGRGVLRYEISPAGGRWRFTPLQPASAHDGLPADAWIGFLQDRDGMVSTRDDVRPFTVDEQRRILRAGACLSCHAGDSPLMRRAVADFERTLAQRSRRCVLPTWP